MRANQGEDRLIWAGANRGDYDLKYAYALVLGSEAKEEDFNGSWVWKLDTIPRASFGNAYIIALGWENA